MFNKQTELEGKIIDFLFWVIFIFAAVKQISMLGANALHCDEALYSRWALMVASGKDIFLSHSNTDKFPLTAYLIALFIKVFGNSDIIVRIPNILVNLLNLFLVYIIAKMAYDKFTALVSVILMLMMEYFWVYGPTALTDPLLLCFVLFSLLYILKRNYFFAGAFLGISLMAKLTGAFFFVPFMFFIYFLSREKKEKFENMRNYMFGFGLVFLAVLAWSFFIQQPSMQMFVNNTPIKNTGSFFNFSAFYEGLQTTVEMSIIIGAAKFMVFFAGLVFLNFSKGNKKKKNDIFLLLTGVLFYLMILFAAGREMSIYDRYFYVIVPVLCIGTGRVITFAAGLPNRKYISVVVFAVLIVVSGITYDKKIDFGAYYNKHNGIKQAKEFFAGRENTKILSFRAGYWHMLYYFFETGGGNSYAYTKEGFERARRYIKKREGNQIYLLVSDKVDDENIIDTINKKFKKIESIYYDYFVSYETTVYHGGNAKYYIFKICRKHGLKQPLFGRPDREPKYKMNVVFDDNVILKGFLIEKGAHVYITYYWRFLSGCSKNWRVYVHFCDGEGNILFGGDHYLSHGLLAFDEVGGNKNVIDKSILYIDENRIKEAEKVRIGLYDINTFERMEFSGNNEVFLRE